MRGSSLAALAMAVGAGSGCLPAPEHRCAGDQDCAGGVCVSPPSACAFPDPLCSGGLRFGEGAGALAGACITADADDAGVDARLIDARPPIDAPPPPDEDGDGVPDAMDNCPHVANPGQEDLSEVAMGMPDGVGDACDPEPTRLGNRIVLFDGFNGGPSSWMAIGATIGGGRVQLGTLGSLTSVQPYPRHLRIVVHGRGTAMAMIGPSLGDAQQGNGSGLTCLQTSGGNSRLRILYNGNNVAETGSTALVGGVDFTLTLTTAGNNWTCNLAIDGEQPVNLRRVSLQSLTNGFISLANPAGAAFELDYVVAIALADT